MIYDASGCKYPGGALSLEGSLPVNGVILRSPWFDSKENAFCTWIKVPDAPLPETRKHVYHVFSEDADIPKHLTYCTSTEVDGSTFHLVYEP